MLMIQKNMLTPEFTELFNLHFQLLVSRYRDTLIQVTNTLCYLCPNMYQCFKIEGRFYCEQLVIKGHTCANKTRDV